MMVPLALPQRFTRRGACKLLVIADQGRHPERSQEGLGEFASSAITASAGRTCRAFKKPIQSKKRRAVLPTESPADDAKCGTVIPQQVDIFLRWEVWRHTEVVCVV